MINKKGFFLVHSPVHVKGYITVKSGLIEVFKESYINQFEEFLTEEYVIVRANFILFINPLFRT